MGFIERQARMHRAQRLLSCGLRPNIVMLDTGLSMPMLRELYREIHGVRAKPGQMPQPEGLLRTRSRLMEASTLMGVYIRLASGHEDGVDLDALISAHDLCRRLGLQIDINHGWVLARAIRAKTILVVPCRKCRAPLIQADTHRLLPTCPFCDSGRDRSAPTGTEYGDSPVRAA